MDGRIPIIRLRRSKHMGSRGMDSRGRMAGWMRMRTTGQTTGGVRVGIDDVRLREGWREGEVYEYVSLFGSVDTLHVYDEYERCHHGSDWLG